MRNLMDFLKIKTGRKLSPGEIELASSGQRYCEPILLAEDDYKENYGRGLRIFYSQGGMLIKHEVTYHQTHDSTIGRVYEPGRRVTRFFNGEGLLVRKRVVVEGENGFKRNVAVFDYNPPGRFVGKRLSRD